MSGYEGVEGDRQIFQESTEYTPRDAAAAPSVWRGTIFAAVEEMQLQSEQAACTPAISERRNGRLEAASYHRNPQPCRA